MYPPPRVWAPQVSICAFAAGVFTGGGGLKNQLKKVAIGVDVTSCNHVSFSEEVVL